MKINNVYCISENRDDCETVELHIKFNRLSARLLFDSFIKNLSENSLFLIPIHSMLGQEIFPILKENGLNTYKLFGTWGTYGFKYYESEDYKIDKSKSLVLITTVFDKDRFELFDSLNIECSIVCNTVDRDFVKQLNGKVCAILQ